MNNIFTCERFIEIKTIIILFSFLLCMYEIHAQVKVTSAGTVDLCVGGAYEVIPDFKIAEKLNADFSASTSLQTYELNAPSNYEFKPGVGSVTIPSGSTDINFASLNITATKITLLYFLNATAQKDSFILENIEVRAVGTNSSNDLRFTGGSASQNQNNTNQYVHAHFTSSQANVNLSASSKVVCANSSDINLNGNPNGGSYTVSPSSSGLVGNTFKPNIAGVGFYVLTYTTTDNGCVGTDTVHITVKAIPEVTFSGLANSYCNNDADVVLIGFPTGGTFSGNGMVGSTFKPNTLSEGNTAITYTYTNAGCTNSLTKSSINIKRAPSVTISLNPNQSAYQTTSGAVEITSTTTNPSSGGLTVLTGNGVSNINKKFYPSTSGEGQFNITSTFTAPNGCSASTIKNVTVISSLSVNINGLLPKYCQGDAISDLFTNNGAGTFSGPGITDVNILTGTAKFSPDLVHFTGPDTTVIIKYEFFIPAFSSFFDRTETTTIFKKPSVLIRQDAAFNSVNFRKVFCKKDSIVLLQSDVSPLNGVLSYSGSGVQSDIQRTFFNPQLASIENIVTLNYTDLNGCTNKDTATALVYENPIPRFSISSLCEGDTIQLKDSLSVFGSNPLDVIEKWDWKVDNETFEGQNNIKIVLQQGNHSFKYTTTTKAGCVSNLQKNVFVGPYPDIAFSWQDACNGDVTKFSNLTEIPIGTGTIDTMIWNFVGIKDTIFKAQNSTPSVSYWNYNYKFLNPGVYTIIQTAITNYNCKSIDSQKVFIFPSVAVDVNTPYVSDFQSSDGGWISSTAADTASSWAWGFANKSIIKSVSNSDFVWATNLTGYHKKDERSYVYSPCLVLTDITRPMIRMDIWSASILNTAGANLQYTTNGVDWEALGDSRLEGINWYNNGANNITSRPSGLSSLDQNGWTGTDSINGWKNVRHIFDNELGSNENIQFRISFAGTENKTDGFAFDNVWVGDRKRIILAEHFTNNSNPNTVFENSELNNLITSNLLNNEPKDIVKLEYHTAFPGPDAMYSRNIPDAGARSLYYGVTQVPYSVVDGTYYKGNTSRINQNTFDTRSLYDPAFEITLNPLLTSTAVSGSVTIENKIPVTNNVTVYISMLERFVNGVTGSNGESSYQWVHAKFLPDAAGTSFAPNWITQNSQVVSFNWSFGTSYLYNPDKLAIIAFVQDNVTKEIYQAAYKGLGATVATGVFDPAETTSTVTLYPNPANDITTVILNGKLAGEYTWVIIDELGRTVGEGTLTDGTDGFAINTQNYASGFYTIRLSNGSHGVKTQKFVVMH